MDELCAEDVFQVVETEQLDTISDLPGDEPEFPIGEGDDFFDPHLLCDDTVPNAVTVKDSPDVGDVRRMQSRKRVRFDTRRPPRASRGTVGCFGGRYPPDPVAKPAKHAEFLALRNAFWAAKKDAKLSKIQGIPATKESQSQYAVWIGRRIKALRVERPDLVSQPDLFRQAVEDWRTSVLGLASRARKEAAAVAVATRKDERSQHLEERRSAREAEAAEEKKKKEAARRKAEEEKVTAKTEDAAKESETKKPKRRHKAKDGDNIDCVPIPVDGEA